LKRSQIINYLIKKSKYKSYLEIGIRNSIFNFDKIKCEYKEGVDPDLLCNAKYGMNSDDFFSKIPLNRKYDIVFIDGMHKCEQVLKDVKNSLDHLSDGGTIVLHDCNPMKERHQVEKRTVLHKKWNGTVWKAFALLRMSREDLFMCVIEEDEGIGVIKKGSQNLFKKILEKELTYNFLRKNRKKLLNLFPFKYFKKLV